LAADLAEAPPTPNPAPPLRGGRGEKRASAHPTSSEIHLFMSSSLLFGQNLLFQLVGWVERSDTHHPRKRQLMGIASLHPSYKRSRTSQHHLPDGQITVFFAFPVQPSREK
jgi:hypothetical protein